MVWVVELWEEGWKRGRVEGKGMETFYTSRARLPGESMSQTHVSHKPYICPDDGLWGLRGFGVKIGMQPVFHCLGVLFLRRRRFCDYGIESLLTKKNAASDLITTTRAVSQAAFSTHSPLSPRTQQRSHLPSDRTKKPKTSNSPLNTRKHTTSKRSKPSRQISRFNFLLQVQARHRAYSGPPLRPPDKVVRDKAK